MATIRQKSTKKNGQHWQVLIRRKGWPWQSATFKANASDFSAFTSGELA